MDTSHNRSLSPILSEEEFLPLIQKRCSGMFSVISALGDENLSLNKLFYFTLHQETEKLEDFLDDHGARFNQKWIYFSELVACMRNFSIAGVHLYHVHDRYSDYLGSEVNNIRSKFEEDSKKTLEYFADTLRRFRQALIEEAKALEVNTEVVALPAEQWQVRIKPLLPYTITDVEVTDEDERIISIAQSYREAYKNFRQQRLHRKAKFDNLSEIIPSKINEPIVSRLESMLHNVQSEYDTYLRGGLSEKDNQWVITLRGLTAIPMHLFEFLRWIVHFYERHENQIRKSDTKEKISKLVDDEKLSQYVIEFGLHYCNRYLHEGNEIAERILSKYMIPESYELPLPRPQGFHARPATYVSFIVQQHGTDLFMIVNGDKYNCRSVLEMLEAGGILADENATTVTFEGDKRSLEDLKILAENNYCEDRDIPYELNYLRIWRNL